MEIIPTNESEIHGIGLAVMANSRYTYERYSYSRVYTHVSSADVQCIPCPWPASVDEDSIIAASDVVNALVLLNKFDGVSSGVGSAVRDVTVVRT